MTRSIVIGAGLVLVTATLSALATYSWVMNSAFLQTEELSGANKLTWPSPSGFVEYLSDNDANGILDDWSFEAWGGEQPGVEGTMWDKDVDGHFETFAFEAFDRFKDVRIFVGYGDRDDDHVADSWVVRFSDAGDESYWTAYSDLNLDGRFDTFVDQENRTRWILMNSRWIQVVEGNLNQNLATIRLNGADVAVRFEAGKWIPVE